MEKAVAFLNDMRRKVCPKTSYLSVSDLYVLKNQSFNEENYGRFRDLVLASDEFKDIKLFLSCDDILSNQKSISGHVLVHCGEFDISTINKFVMLLVSKKTVLALILCSEPSFIHSVRFQVNKNYPTFSVSEYNFDSWHILAMFVPASSHDLISSSSSTEDNTLSFNNHPTTKSRHQFKFLWSRELSKSIDRGKSRVIQRLNSKASQHPWDEIIQSCLQQGMNDFHIYSRIRKLTLNRSLEDDLSFEKASQETNNESQQTEGENTWDRSDMMVKNIIACIPSQLLPQNNAHPSKHMTNKRTNEITSFLDYGCAEGAITAELGKALHLNHDFVFGADVRVIASPGFTFIHLQPEDSISPPPSRSILKEVPDGSIDLITISMVMHHVIHPLETLKELRRVISSHGVLVMREHNCSTKSDEMGAFLDITHGLYSLAWSVPVEWPHFLDEYNAYYRSREEWTALLISAGFRLSEPCNPEARKLYNFSDKVITKKDGNIVNVIKAYYAVYVPDPLYVPTITDGRPKKRNSHDIEQEIPPKDVEDRGKSSGLERVEVWESKKHRGQYYIMNSVGKAEWVILQDNKSCCVHSVTRKEFEISRLINVDI